MTEPADPVDLKSVDEVILAPEPQELMSDDEYGRSDPEPRMITAAALAIAEAHAARDRADLARLVREGKVLRDPSIGRNVAGAARFREEIEQLVKPRVNVAIRPKSKRRKR